MNHYNLFQFRVLTKKFILRFTFLHHIDKILKTSQAFQQLASQYTTSFRTEEFSNLSHPFIVIPCQSLCQVKPLTF